MGRGRAVARPLVRAALIAAGAAALGAAPAWCGAPERAFSAPYRAQRAERILSLDSNRHIDVNQINMWVTNFGSFAWDVSGQGSPPGLVFPRGTAKTAVFASGLWLGCTVAGQARTVVAEYSQEYNPGRILPGGAFDNPSDPRYVVYKVVRFTGNPEDTAHVVRSADEIAADPLIDRLAHHSWSEYLKGAKPCGAPTRMYRLPDTRTPAPDDSVDVEGPDVTGDQMLWAVYNDADARKHTNDAGNSPPLGVEIQQTTFAFNRQGALGNTVFLKFKITYQPAAGVGDTLKDMYVSLWADPDLGGFTDDLVGCDTTLSLGYVYNSDNDDQVYGKIPPAVGYDFFLGPVNAQGETLGLSSFNKYINGTDPASTSETYNYMRGLQANGGTLTDPVSGQDTHFFVSGDPETGTGWLDSNPADRRFLLSSGPFQMAPGDTQTVVGAIVIGQCGDAVSSVTALKFFDTFAQDAFDRNFDLPSPPAQPRVDVAVDHERVTLSWDSASRFSYHEPGYVFEGYNVYQGESVAGPWHLIATYDENNAVRDIDDQVFDLNTCRVIENFPVARGQNTGVRYSHVVTTDEVRGGPLKDGTEYYFAVTAYSYGAEAEPKFKMLENAPSPIHAIPQRPPAGTDLATATFSCPVVRQITPGPRPSTDRVVAEVVDPEEVTGHDYRVTFRQVAPDSSVWNLIDDTTHQTLLADQTNKRGDLDYRIVDGLRIQVIGPQHPDSGLAEADFLCRPNHALEGYNFGAVNPAGGEAFNHGATAAINFFGSSLDPAAQPDSFTTVELRFSHTTTQKGYRFFRREVAESGNPPPGGRGWLYGGFHTVPFTVWDTDRNLQLDVAFVERLVTDPAGTPLPDRLQPATVDGTWLPSEAENGGREILAVIRSGYTPDEKPGIATNGAVMSGALPLQFMLWSRRLSRSARIPDGSVFRFLWNASPSGPNDEFVIHTRKLARENHALAAGNLGLIRAVPNPYFNRSRYELNQFSRVVRFINLPETATVRIFNLAGDRVRTLHKEDPGSSILTWDLLTDFGLPVASGVYVYHVEAPGVGSTIGRLVVFMEKERLNNF